MSLALTELQAVTDDYIDKTPVDIYFMDNVLLYMLLGNGNLENTMVTGDDLVDGGQMIRVFLEHGEANSGSYGAKTKIELSKKKIMNAARFRWAGYYASNSIDLDDRVQNSGEAQMIDLVMTKMENIQKTIRNKMGSEIYASAADSTCFLGLGNLFNTTTSTAYGTIAEDDMAKWKANVITTSEAINYAVMQKIRRTASVDQNNMDKPNLYITTNTLVDAYERGLQTQQRFSDVKLVDAGFENVLFKRAPVVADDRQTSGYLDALNLRHLMLKTHKDYNFTKPKWEYSKDEPDTFTANVRYIGQLVTKHRASHCRHTNLAEPA